MKYFVALCLYLSIAAARRGRIGQMYEGRDEVFGRPWVCNECADCLIQQLKEEFYNRIDPAVIEPGEYYKEHDDQSNHPDPFPIPYIGQRNARDVDSVKIEGGTMRGMSQIKRKNDAVFQFMDSKKIRMNFEIEFKDLYLQYLRYRKDELEMIQAYANKQTVKITLMFDLELYTYQYTIHADKFELGDEGTITVRLKASYAPGHYETYNDVYDKVTGNIIKKMLDTFVPKTVREYVENNGENIFRSCLRMAMVSRPEGDRDN